MTHLETLELKLSHERNRLAQSQNANERKLRSIWVTQLEKEIEDEKRFIGNKTDNESMSVDQILAELTEDEIRCPRCGELRTEEQPDGCRDWHCPQ